MAAPRPDLRSVQPYVSPQVPASARLNTNECPRPLSDEFARDLADAVARLELNRYPDGQMRELRRVLAESAKHSIDGTWAANGSNEILTELLLAYGGPGRRALVFEPTYLLHARLAWLTHTGVDRLTIDAPFEIGPSQADAAIAMRPDVIFVCSPNNPTGNSQRPDVVRRLAERSPALVVVDEAYIEFGGESALPLVAEHPNVVIVRTLSKAFALAGARIGYCLATPEVVGDLERVRLPYHMSALSQAAGMTAIRHAEDARSIIESIRAERDRIVDALRAMPGLEVFPSVANFVLFVPPKPAADVWQGLLERGVLVRDLSNVVPNALRVTAGTGDEVDMFLKALEEVLRS